MVNSDYLKGLNDAQIEAVTHLEGPLLIVAGAGSGKTKVLTSRIANIIYEKKAFPNQILAVTFTNKAAKEMKMRIRSLTNNEDSESIWMGTFHSIFARILRQEAAVIGYSNNFTIYDNESDFTIYNDKCLQFMNNVIHRVLNSLAQQVSNDYWLEFQ